jgi:hypothetical protein
MFGLSKFKHVVEDMERATQNEKNLWRMFVASLVLLAFTVAIKTAVAAEPIPVAQANAPIILAMN